MAALYLLVMFSPVPARLAAFAAWWLYRWGVCSGGDDAWCGSGGSGGSCGSSSSSGGSSCGSSGSGGRVIVIVVMVVVVVGCE